MSTSLASAGPSDQVLRTLAAVPVSSSILDLGCGAGQQTEALLRLGFPVHACDPRPEAIHTTRERVRDLIDEETAENCVRPLELGDIDTLDASFDWVLGTDPEVFLDGDDSLTDLLAGVRSVLVPGGWFYLILPAASDAKGTGSTRRTPPSERPNGWQADELSVDRLDTSLVEARPPERVDENGTCRVHAIYRRVEAAR